MNKTFLTDNLHYLREIHGYTQTQLTRYLGISRNTYAQYEAGLRAPSMEMLIELADFYHLSLDTMLQSDRDQFILDLIHATYTKDQIPQLMDMVRRLPLKKQKRLLVRAQKLCAEEKLIRSSTPFRAFEKLWENL